ncbi:universal stress protein UspA [Natrarchaeobius halalkaliphilus]|uniref:Universal stress protein UspA n=1 Tax=Natrarchaeobius halalkaliphilus TaxID=1679091 RepID=A0A3N6LP50_9EURY|nr:universal stress protein [Natrarchaeobius halalkaliphilus]RQG88027.1 universal stress protein UspA [Natrarchaeobius halalkaliphilus]
MTTEIETDGLLLVPVANDETASRQLETAVDVARDRSYRIRLLYVLDVPPQLSLVDGRRYLLEDDTERMLADAVTEIETRGIPVDSRIRLARGITTGITGAIESYDADAVLMGWRGRPPRQNVVLGTHLDRVLRGAACDVLVERIKTPRPDVDSVLVPVVGGPHDEFATETGGAIARRRNADVTLLYVNQSDNPDRSLSEGESVLLDRSSLLEDVDSVERKLLEADDVAGTITDWTTEHDVTVVGVSRGGLIQRKLLGTISEAVGRHAAGSVILAKRHDPVPSRLKRLVP